MIRNADDPIRNLTACRPLSTGTAESEPMPLLSGSAAQPSQSNGGEASFGMSGLSGGQGANGTPHARRAGARPSFSGGRRTSLDAQDWRRRSLSGSRRRSLSQAFSEGPSPLHRPGWRGDLGQFQGPRGRLQDRRRSFSMPLSPVASVVRCFCRLATRHAPAAEAITHFNPAWACKRPGSASQLPAE